MKLARLKSALKKKSALPKIVVMGLAIVAMAVWLKAKPAHQGIEHQPVLVEYINAKVQKNTPRVEGFGLIKPRVKFDGIAEVSGRIIFLNPQLIAGATLSKDTLLARIDDTDYQLALAQAQANIIIYQAQLTELKQNQNSVNKNLALVEKKIEIALREFKRKQNLRNQKSISESQLDNEQQQVLNLRQEKVSLQQQLDILPSQKQSLNAQLNSAIALSQQQQRNIDRTNITLPFSGRISAVKLEKDQFVSQGQLMFSAQGIEQVEIEAQFTLEQLRPFIEMAIQTSGDRPIQLNSLIKDNRLRAQVELALTPGETWPAGVIAFREGLDLQSRTLGVLVRIEKPYENIIPGKRPPLLEGMQASVKLMANAIDTIAVPVSALHLDNIYLVGNDSSLNKISIKPKLIMNSVALFSPQDLLPNSRIITSDLVPAIQGMHLSLQHNIKAQVALDKMQMERSVKEENTSVVAVKNIQAGAK
ncbi:MAG: hypothetical protein V7785_11950 [Bermanella sp.]